MANYRFKAAPVYVGSQKWAELQNCSLDIESNDEPQEGIDAYLGDSEGIIMCTLECDTIVPYGGQSVNVLDLIKNKKNVNVGVLVDGKLLQVQMRCRKYGVKSQSKNGTVKGTFSFGGGEPSAN